MKNRNNKSYKLMTDPRIVRGAQSSPACGKSMIQFREDMEPCDPKTRRDFSQCQKKTKRRLKSNPTESITSIQRDSSSLILSPEMKAAFEGISEAGGDKKTNKTPNGRRLKHSTADPYAENRPPKDPKLFKAIKTSRYKPQVLDSQKPKEQSEQPKTIQQLNDVKSVSFTQTEQISEDLLDVISEESVEIQTQPPHEAVLEGSDMSVFHKARNGEDKDCQTELFQLCDLRMAVKPVVNNLARAVLEQSLLESLEEEEALSLRDQKNIFTAARDREIERIRRLAERERSVQEEKASLIRLEMTNQKREQDVTGRLRITAFSENLAGDVLGDTMHSLARDGFLQNASPKEIYVHFVPWLNHQTQAAIRQETTSNNILDGIIRSIVTEREAEIAALQWVLRRNY